MTTASKIHKAKLLRSQEARDRRDSAVPTALKRRKRCVDEDDEPERMADEGTDEPKGNVHMDDKDKDSTTSGSDVD